ncbi:uncharacterized protein ISCGN_011455 [Ixodes scapularis]
MATESKKQRRPNFTEAELETLVDGYEARRTAIDAKGDGPHGSAAKQRAWLQITKDLYAVSGVRRDVAEVKKKWADYKSIHKKRGDMEDPSHKIIESQQAIVDRLDQIIELQKQRVALEAYKLNVQFVDGKIVPM